MRDPYQVLGLAPGATATEIKAAFRRLALRYHPDRNPDNATALNLFRAVSEAFTVLSDPAQRRAYEAARAEKTQRPARPRAGSRPDRKRSTPKARPADAWKDERFELPGYLSVAILLDLVISIAFFAVVMEKLPSIASIGSESLLRLPVRAAVRATWMQEFAAAAVLQAAFASFAVLSRSRPSVLFWVTGGKILVIVGLGAGIIGLATIQGPLIAPSIVLFWDVALFTAVAVQRLRLAPITVRIFTS